MAPLVTGTVTSNPHIRAREESAPWRRAASHGRRTGGARAATMTACTILIGALLAPGCGPVHMQMDGTFRMEGPLLLADGSYVSDDMFDALEEGSHKSWAVALFGEPEQKTVMEDGSEVWRWTFRETVMDLALDPALLKVGGGGGKDEERKRQGDGDEPAPAVSGRSGTIRITNTYVHIVDGRVESKWRG